jgi:hypothetical protein
MMRASSAGVEVRRFSEETTLLVVPAGEQLLVAASVERLLAILDRCDRTASFDELVLELRRCIEPSR